MQVQFDAVADVLYIQLSDLLSVRTQELDRGTLLDLDEQGHLVGIEIIRPARTWPLSTVLDRFEIGEADQATLRAMWPGDDSRFPFEIVAPKDK